MNRPKQIGTRGETGVVRVARLAGFPSAERRALAGSADLGDILLCPGLVAEVKAGAAAKSASLGQIQSWLAETDRERINAGAALALLVVQRKGFAPARAGSWDCWMELDDVIYAAGSGNRVDPMIARAAVCLRLDHALMLLRLSGWGDPLPVPRPAGLTLRRPPPVPEVRVLDDDEVGLRCACARPATVGLTHSAARCYGPESTPLEES